MLFQDPDSFLDEVEDIARLGGERLMAHWRSLEAHQISEKARNDFVSAADLASEETILEAVATRFPGHRVLDCRQSGQSFDRPVVTALGGCQEMRLNECRFQADFRVPLAISLQISHSGSKFALGPSGQLRAFAKMRAVVVLPVPLGPTNK